MNRNKLLHRCILGCTVMGYSGVQVCLQVLAGVTHCDSLCLAVDLQRTEAFWKMDLLEVNGRWSSLPLLNRKQCFHGNTNILLTSVWLFQHVVVFLGVFTSSSNILNSSNSFWSLMSWMSFLSRRSSPSICLTCIRSQINRKTHRMAY